MSTTEHNAMLAFPQAKVNLGLNIVGRRPDGYHLLETVFYPVPVCDALELYTMADAFPSDVDCDLKVTGINVEGDEQSNLVVRAYAMLKADFPRLPRLHAHLHKAIPTQAGMGGGSSDATAMLTLLNTSFDLGLNDAQLAQRAVRLGADCPFFVQGRPAYAQGIGEKLEPLDFSLAGWHLAVVRPNVSVSTREAFAHVTPRRPDVCCRDVVCKEPVEHWRDALVNDFEQSIFPQHPEIAEIKNKLYALGAAYSSMSGSGSAVYGLFREPVNLEKNFHGLFSRMVKL
jgi:4-diphosphocytidyl-2-C-methyl-D-erythritol kinase